MGQRRISLLNFPGFYSIKHVSFGNRFRSSAASALARFLYISRYSRVIPDTLYRSLHRWGRVLNLTGATTDWLDTRDQGERLLEQATLLEPVFHLAAQDELRRWIADEARTLRAVYG